MTAGTPSLGKFGAWLNPVHNDDDRLRFAEQAADDAGADHVAIQSLAPQNGDPMPGLRQLAEPLGLG